MAERQLEFFARCASGFETVLAQELRGMGLHRVRPLHGGVAFFGARADGYRTCLWSRVATRIQLVLARVPAANADELYQNAVAFHWEKHVRDGATIAVQAHGTNANLRNTQFTALKVKDALCDCLREVRGTRPDVDARQPDFAVNVALHEERATLFFNLSGESLHRRGYRQEGVQTEAPLKETLAAGILLAAGWEALAQEGGVLVDPMCGSGTFAVEGALIAAGMAPGLLRERWGFEGWVQHDRQAWEELLEEARAMAAQPYTAARIIAGDIDESAVQIAHDNATRAKVSSLVRFHVDDAANLARYLRGVRGARGLLVANPPYGLRLLSQAALPQVRAALSTAVDALPRGWQVTLVTPDLGMDTELGRVPDEVISCFNGPIEAWVRRYDLTSSEPLTQEAVSLSGVQRSVRIADGASAQYAGRLRKVAKERTRWARKAGVTCFRVYDADLPDYPVSVDVFQGAGSNEGQLFAVIEERPRPRSVDVQRAGRHFADAVVLTAAVLDIPLENVVQKPWATDALYDRTREAMGERVACVSEGGWLYDVDLLGTSGKNLPLDLRLVREYIGEHAAGARFANLFAAGDAATVSAAGGGARLTVTVDASKERLDWTAAVLRLNDLSGKQHGFVAQDVRAWLAREAKARRTYDLVLCSPPAFLAARGAQEAWNLANDLSKLLRLISRVLAPDGSCVLVLPAQGPVPDGALTCRDMTAKMIPHDFERSREHQRIYVLTHGHGY